MNHREGVCAVFDANIEAAGYRGDAEIVLIAVFGDRRTIYTDMWSDEKAQQIERVLKCEILRLSSFDPDLSYVGHNIPEQFPAKDTFDMLKEAKSVSAEVLQNEGKRYSLTDLVAANITLDAYRFYSIVGYLQTFAMFRSGKHVLMARTALSTAGACHRLFHAVAKKRRLRFPNPQTGKKAHAEVDWLRDTEEE